MKRNESLVRLGFSSSQWSQRFEPSIRNTPSLPVIDWDAVGESAPQLLNTSSANLPKADVIVITWADAEWAAMEHVFCASSKTMSYSARNTDDWSGWQKYSQGAQSTQGWDYWGSWRLVQIAGKTVMLFKSNTHLDFPGQQSLAQMIERLIEEAAPELILSIGTAGGARPTDHIGTVNVIHAGTLYNASKPESQWPEYSNKWSPDWSIISKAGFKKLLFPVPTTPADIQSLCDQFNSNYHTNYSPGQININNLNLADSSPAINNLTGAGTPLLTTNSFVVGTSAGNLRDFACVEMDDAVIAQVCAGKNTPFGFVRNISDPVQNSTLSKEIQKNWGSTIYDMYGIYTSYNGAIAAWAIIAAS